MKTTFTIIKNRENVNFNGTFSFSMDEMKKAIRTAKKAVTKREDLLDGKLILQVSKLHAAIFSDSWGITAGVYFPIISTDAEFTAILSPEIIAKIEAEKGKKIEAVLQCCICQIVLSYSENSFEFENPRCDHYGPHFTYSGDASFSLDADDLKTAIKHTAPITSKDGGRYALTGIYIDADAENEVNFVSTDGCRMSVQRIETAVNIQDRALIEKNTMLKLAKIFDGYKGNIEINSDCQFAYFIGRGITVICSQLSGKFPDWKSGMGQIKDFHRHKIASSEFCKIEPLKNGITPAEPGIVFHKIERLGAIAAAAPAEPENAVLIGADAPDFPNMKLNYNYVTDFIKNISSEESFLIQYKTGADGVLFTAGNWNYLLMPMNTIYIPEEHTRRIEYLKKDVKTARAEETRTFHKYEPIREQYDANKQEYQESIDKEDEAEKEQKFAKIAKKEIELRFSYNAAKSTRERAEKELQATEKMFESSREKWGRFFENIENIAWKKNGIGTAQEKPLESLETAAAADAVTNTAPAEKAPKTQENATQEDETKQAEKTTSAGAAVVLSSDDLRGDNFGKTLESVKNTLTQGVKQEQKKEATWDGFLNQSKEVWINIAMNTGRFPMKVIYFPAEKIAIVKHKKTWYAIEAITGSAFYTMPNFHDLLNTLRHQENRTPILALIESVRSKNPVLNPIDKDGNILDISPAEYEKMQAEKQEETQEATAEKPKEKAPTEKAEQTQEEEQEKRVKIAPTGSAAPRATVPEPEPMEAPTTEAEPEPAPTPTEPEPMEPEPNAEKPFEIGTYTTKKGKIKTSIRFFQPPTPAQIDALKSAWYWEYNGTWNGSPRKLPEIFKH